MGRSCRSSESRLESRQSRFQVLRDGLRRMVARRDGSNSSRSSSTRPGGAGQS